jgi:hypothetical protein
MKMNLVRNQNMVAPNSNDNLPPIKLKVAVLDCLPDVVFIAMNRDDAIYGASPEETREIARELMAAADQAEASTPTWIN